MHAFAAELYPLLRSITGPGQRATLAAIGGRVPIEVTEVATGTSVLDWTVPKEWRVRDAWIRGPGGNIVVRLADSSLRLMGYSTPVHARLPLEELRPHLYTDPEHPNWIPWRTSYYAERWGFCLTQHEADALEDGEYEVRIDAELVDGALSYAESVVEGESDREVLITAHTCHPALANDNLAGIAVVTELAAQLHALAGEGLRPRYTHRFLFAPGTIGAITWLARNRPLATEPGRVVAGLVAACLGDPGGLTYKRSRRGDAFVDRAACHVLAGREPTASVRDFVPYGYDERQYCSPGYDLPVGSLTRTPHGEYPQYHTSADDLDLITPWALADSLDAYLDVLDVLDRDRRWRNLAPHGEPQLGRRGLYGTVGGTDVAGQTMALLWVLNQADGDHSLLDTAERSGLPFAVLADAAGRLADTGLLAPVDFPDTREVPR